MALTVRGREIKFSLAWLKPPPVPPDGNMSLYDHLRELRYRVVFSVVTIVVGMIVCAFFHEALFDIMLRPLTVAQHQLAETHPDLDIRATTKDVAAPFLLNLKVVGVAALVVTSPIWLHQLWSFIVPGLLANEKKWATIFVGTATPLFLAGVATGYFIMPKGIQVLLAFTPSDLGILNLLELNEFLGFLIRVMLVFGIGYLVPLVMVMLNVVGVLSAVQMKRVRPFIIFGAFVFAAMATPTTDPVSMVAMAIPMTILMLIAEQIAKVNDRRRAKRDEDPIAQDKVLAELNAQDEREAAERAAAEASDEPKALESADKSGDKS